MSTSAPPAGSASQQRLHRLGFLRDGAEPGNGENTAGRAAERVVAYLASRRRGQIAKHPSRFDQRRVAFRQNPVPVVPLDRERIRMIASERHYLRTRLRSMGVYSTDAHANFVYLPASGRPWRQVFEGTGLKVRNYADGGVRITVGNRQSTRAVLAAVASAA